MASTTFLVRVWAALVLSVLCLSANAAAYPEAGDRHRPEKTHHQPLPIPTQAPKRWVHPGVYVHQSQLDYVSHKVAKGAQPWSDAFDSMLKYNYSSPTRTAQPYKVVQCGPTSTPNIGCYQEREDSMAAYINALAYSVTKEKAYAKKAIHYMDSWSTTIEGHNNSNAPLQAAWSAANWVRAGEIMRYARGGWTEKGIKAFENMLRRAYLPIIVEGDVKNNGNWDLVMMEASIGAAVFLEDRALYTASMSKFAGRVPAYIYLTSDGPLPVPGRGISNTKDAIIKYWFNQATFPVSGITQETCRDFAHVSYGISSMAHVAETSRIQGEDLWKTELGTRVGAALELHAPFLTGDKEIPEWLCKGAIGRSLDPVLEPPYNALANRLHQKMPFTKKLLLEQRPAEIGEPNPLFIGFETLTNADIPF
ncbi:hypothetical protein V495_05981 [Pseudogymnoascus sp. VKM F-4514 (FW-929)]|nr:hypothetical protein V495_05981 [Pseudogymnoascus sp. VKM F-4514 (FW-929)]KFY65922.1 hypothetical protein V497_01241 [Pseudogymnoascus sp. VKM F-4516 (FW-969)]